MSIRDGIVAVLTSEDLVVGTGFLAAENLILTCAHVVGSEARMRVKFATDGSSGFAEVQILSPKEALDLAALRVSATPSGAEVLPLGVPTDALGREFHTYGYAIVGKVQGIGARGQVVELVEDARWVQLRSQDVDHGMSGGPVVDESQGAVIGMVSWGKTSEYRRNTRNDDTSFALSADTIRQLCPQLRLREGCPYRGLERFEEEHADVYFGREQASAELVDWLTRRDFVALVGVSGSGKSSLVRAGLARALKEHPLPGLVERWRITFEPGRLPNLDLLLAVAGRVGIEKTAEMLEIHLGIWNDRDALAAALAARTADELAQSVRRLAPTTGMLLIIDQFERLYRECLDLKARSHFIETLLALAGEQVKVLLTVRADFYASLMEHAGLLEQVRQGVVHLLAMTPDKLRQAIEGPARSWGRSLQPGLAEQLAGDVQGRAGDLPLLQFALTELWAQDAAGGMLKRSSYAELGYSDGKNVFPGVQGAVAKRAEKVWEDLSVTQQQGARRIFLRLTSARGAETAGGIAADSSRRAWLAELDSEAQTVTSILVEARLLASGQDAASGQPTLEVAHESLLRAWPRLARWLTDTRPFLQWYENDLAPFLRNWLENDRKPGYLLPAAMLDEARTWLGKYPEELAGPGRDFIEQSISEQERQKKAREKLRLRIMLGLVAGLLVTILLSVLSAYQWRRADEQAGIALTQEQAAQIQSDINHARELRARSLLELQSNAECALGLSVLAYDQAKGISGLPLSEFEDAVRETLRHAHTRSVLVGHTGIVNSVAWSPDGGRLATASDDATVRIWDSSTGQSLKTLAGIAYRATSVAWSPDGKYLAAGDGAGNISIWNAGSFEEIAGINGHTGLVRGLDWSVDGKLASGGDDGTIKIWGFPFREPIRTLAGHSDMIYGLDFAPDGRHLASASADYSVILWNIEDGTSTTAWLTTQPVQVSWSPDGAQLVVGVADGTARLFSAFPGSLAETKSWQAHNAGTKSVDWSPTGKLIATGSDDGTIRVWDAQTQSQLYELTGHEDVIFDVSWSPDGETVASAAGDETARIWAIEASSSRQFNYSPAYLMDVAWGPDRQSLALASSSAFEGYKIRVMDTSAWSGNEYDPGHSGSIMRLAWHPTQQVIASSGADKTIVLFDLARDASLLTLSGHSGVVNGVDWSPDGLRLVSGGDQTVRIWDAATGASIDTLSGHTGDVNDVDWHPTEDRVASISVDGTIRLWDLKARGNDETFENQGAIGVRVRWDPEGNRLLSGWSDGSVIVWNAQTGERLLETGGHSGPVWAVAWSPDGNSFAAGFVDGSILIFDVQTGDKIATIQGHQGTIRGLDWSPDGTQLASAGMLDGTLQVDNVQFSRILALAMQQIKRGLTTQQYSACTSDQ